MKKNKIPKRKKRIIFSKGEKLKEENAIEELEEIEIEELDQSQIIEIDELVEQLAENVEVEEKLEVGQLSFEERRQEFVASLNPENQIRYNNYEKRKDAETRKQAERVALLRTISKLEEPITEEEQQREEEIQEFFAEIKNKLNEYEKTQKEITIKEPVVEEGKKIKTQKNEYKKPQTNKQIIEQMIEDIKAERELKRREKQGKVIRETKTSKDIKEVKPKKQPVIKVNKNNNCEHKRENNKSNRVSGTSMADILDSKEFKNMWKDSEQEER